ncbi:TetR/AcrR family transcriptional regulator [Nonomuraea sp. ZG12]|uniref:TetR/AcrR family transcriptional regulator n=1 Tax=Nonomuraea sp. ZG12 TaxID=3452207 RepID=UPI003F893590
MNSTNEAKVRAGGRGARERILAAAEELFYGQGVNATGMAELATTAHVSKRTLYQHFATKDELIEACLRRFQDDEVLGNELALKRTDLAPVERLLALFTAPAPGFPLRGCLFSNTAVEIADTTHPVREFVADHKRRFAEQILDIAREAGASDPEALAGQLSVLFDGASARAAVLSSIDPYAQARAAAEILIEQAIAAP